MEVSNWKARVVKILKSLKGFAWHFIKVKWSHSVRDNIWDLLKNVLHKELQCGTTSTGSVFPHFMFFFYFSVTEQKKRGTVCYSHQIFFFSFVSEKPSFDRKFGMADHYTIPMRYEPLPCRRGHQVFSWIYPQLNLKVNWFKKEIVFLMNGCSLPRCKFKS